MACYICRSSLIWSVSVRCFHIFIDGFQRTMCKTEYSPRYFDEPEKYKPSRWYGVSNDEAFSAFSLGTFLQSLAWQRFSLKRNIWFLGPRACIGRKFATVESICFLTLLLRDFKVEPLLRAGETKEQWRDRTLDGHVGLTLGVVDVPVRFVRRTIKWTIEWLALYYCIPLLFFFVSVVCNLILKYCSTEISDNSVLVACVQNGLRHTSMLAMTRTLLVPWLSHSCYDQATRKKLWNCH